MDKYFTTESYAEKQGVDRTAIIKRLQGQKGKQIKTVDIATKTLHKLILEHVNDEPYIIALMNLKGGCGKTTLACHIASLLSKQDFKVLLIDTDHQNQCELFFPVRDYEFTILDAIRGQDITNCIYRIETKDSELDIIFSDYSLALEKINDIKLLSKLIAPIKHNYDFIIVDTSPNFDIIAQNVINMATNIFIPIIPNRINSKGLEHYIKAIDNITKQDIITGIILTMVEAKTTKSKVEPRTSQHKYYSAELIKEYGSLILEHIIPKDVLIAQMSDINTTIFDFKPSSNGSIALKRMVHELLQKL